MTCDVSRGPRTQSIRLTVDREAGLDVDGCARASRLVATLLDADPVVRGAYNLEVSSPGMHRPIWTPRHFERFIGERVVLQRSPARALGTPESVGETEGGEAVQHLEGEIGPLEGDGVWIEPVDKKGTRRLVPFSEIRSAQLRMDPWKRRARAADAPKPLGAVAREHSERES